MSSEISYSGSEEDFGFGGNKNDSDSAYGDDDFEVSVELDEEIEELSMDESIEQPSPAPKEGAGRSAGMMGSPFAFFSICACARWDPKSTRTI